MYFSDKEKFHVLHFKNQNVLFGTDIASNNGSSEHRGTRTWKNKTMHGNLKWCIHQKGE